MIDLKLKAGLIVIIFLLLLGLDAPEFIVCNYNMPDEIHDIPRLLIDGSRLSTNFHIEKLKILKGILRLSSPPDKNLNHPAMRKSNEPYGSQQSIGLYYVAEIRRQYLCWEDRYQQNHGEQEINLTNLIKGINLLTIFAEKSNQISSFLFATSFSILRI